MKKLYVLPLKIRMILNPDNNQRARIKKVCEFFFILSNILSMKRKLLVLDQETIPSE